MKKEKVKIAKMVVSAEEILLDKLDDEQNKMLKKPAVASVLSTRDDYFVASCYN